MLIHEYNSVKNNFAVTLTEVLVVVIILAILAGIGVPIYISIVEKMKDKEALASLRELAVAENIYFSENDQYYPNAGSGQTVYNANLNQINEALNTFIVNKAEWDYCVRQVFDTSRKCFVYARRRSDIRTWRIRQESGGLPEAPSKEPWACGD